MALLDIVTTFGQAPVLSFERGDIGSVIDMFSRDNEFITPTLGGGGVFPLEGDVDSGIIYGPSGTDYTGTLTQPDPSDVLAGVLYGADGTEFTGTATGGGGGGIFIVNE